jgi:predicted lipoprotein with Yx(FWY)xxD motif
MRYPKRVLVAVGLGAAVVGGVVGLLGTTGSSSTGASVPAAQIAVAPAGSATINVATATVNGRSEQILVDSRGLPLYTFASDTATTSHVSGGLAALWPPLDAAKPTESGAMGKLSVVSDANGQQVQYNGHYLYTFVDDSPGHVTGQGVQDFFIATPGMSTGSATIAASPPATQRSGYGY